MWKKGGNVNTLLFARLLKTNLKDWTKTGLILDMESLSRGLRAVAMGLADIECNSIGSTLYKRNQSAKEADSSWMNQVLRARKDQFPHFVIEAGLSESLPCLRADAKWWVVQLWTSTINVVE